MSARLGELLLQGGALTEKQLEEVLNAQSIYGGRLGTNLVEMGLLSEEDLARALNQKLGVAPVDVGSLEAVSPSLIALLPQDMVQRFQVLPVALDGKKLTLAMADPADFKAIDEIGFFTGLVIVPRVCSELRLSMALERYYGIKLALHFIPVAGGVRTKMVSMTRESAGLESSELAPTPATDQGSADPVTEPAGFSTSDSDRERSQEDNNSLAGTGAAVCKTAEPLDAVAKRLAAASSKGEVVTILMSYLKEELDRVGFLGLKRGSAVGVQAFAKGAAIADFAGCTFGLESASQLNQVLKEKTPYQGKLAEAGVEGQILTRIGGAPGADAFLLPLVISGVSAAFLMVLDENVRLASGFPDLQRVVVKAGFAFEMQAIRKRIVMG